MSARDELYAVLRLAGEDRAEAEGLTARHRAEVLREAALIVVASCPDHQPADAQGSWMDCHCPVADEFRRMAAASEKSSPTP